MREVLGQHFLAAEDPGRLDDRSVPVGNPKAIARCQGGKDQDQRELLHAEAAERLDERDGLVMSEPVRLRRTGGLNVELRRMLVSAKRTAPVDFTAPEAVAGSEAPDRGQHFVLQTLAPLEIRFAVPEPHQELTHERAERGVPLGGLDAGPAIDEVGQ